VILTWDPEAQFTKHYSCQEEPPLSTTCYFGFRLTGLLFQILLQFRSGPLEVFQRRASGSCCWCMICTGRMHFLSPTNTVKALKNVIKCRTTNVALNSSWKKNSETHSTTTHQLSIQTCTTVLVCKSDSLNRKDVRYKCNSSYSKCCCHTSRTRSRHDRNLFPMNS